ncbi:MAG: hypothetical protein ACLS9K_14165 [Lachnospira eligens]
MGFFDNARLEPDKTVNVSVKVENLRTVMRVNNWYKIMDGNKESV